MMEDSQEGQGGPVFGAAGESYDSTYTNKTCRGSSDFFWGGRLLSSCLHVKFEVKGHPTEIGIWR